MTRSSRRPPPKQGASPGQQGEYPGIQYAPAPCSAPTRVALPRPSAVPPSTNLIDAMPAELQSHFEELEQWAIANRNDARHDTFAFWALKAPAILTAASAGVWALFALETVSVISGAIASVCVIIDGVLPRGMLRNIHLRAFHDIRILSSRMMSEWRSRRPNANDDETARSIIRRGEKERQRIATYIRDAETALKAEQET